MSSVVEMRASAASVLALIWDRLPPALSQVAWLVRRQRQFTNGSPNESAAGLMNRLRMLPSRIGFLSLADWNARSSAIRLHKPIVTNGKRATMSGASEKVIPSHKSFPLS
jgi:hypothetical protein